MYYYLVDIQDVRKLVQNNFSKKDLEAQAFVECPVVETFEMLVDQTKEKVSSFNITQNTAQEVSLTTINFRNFTNDNLYARIFSLLYRHLQNPKSKMPL